MNQIMQGHSLTIFGDGEQKRAFTYIDDVAPIIAGSINEKKAYNQVFNIGSNCPISVNQLAEEVSICFNVKTNVIHLKERNEVKIAFSDHNKLQKYFGKRPKYSLSEGLERMVKWAKEVGVKKSKEFENIEIERGLPQGWRGKLRGTK